MTIWERLFGTPERTAETIEYVDQIDACDWMSRVNEDRFPPERCVGCIFDYGPYGCELKDMTLVEWLNQEVGNG